MLERLIYSYPCATPFDAIFMDIWSPGKFIKGGVDTKSLTVMDGAYSFVVSIPIESVDSLHITQKVFMHTFTPFGLPLHVFIDNNSTFKLVAKAVYIILEITWKAISCENHQAL